MAFNFTSTFNDDGISVALEKWPQELNRSIMHELFRIANDMRNHIIKEMKDSPPNFFKASLRSGTRRKVNAKDRRYHYPSIPGEFPRIDSGRLVGSINVVRSDEAVGVGSLKQGNIIANYSKYLEDPKKTNRPFIKPTYETFAPTISARIMEAIKARASKK